MNSLLETICNLRKDTHFLIDTTNTNRYRIVINENDGTKTAYYFSSPIYNINTKKIVDLKFTKNDTPRLVGSNAQIIFSDIIKMNNNNGNCFIPLQKQIKRISDKELWEGENKILPTTNGFIYKISIREAKNKQIMLKTDRAFPITRSNNKFFAFMIDKFTPLVCVSAIGVEDDKGNIISPFCISEHKISEYEHVISLPINHVVGKYIVFEINMYEKKLIQDTTVESLNPKMNNAFGSTSYIGTTPEFGEQWLYSRIDYMCINDIAGNRVKSIMAYIPKLNKSDLNIDAYRVSERFCSFGSTWDNKKDESNYINQSYNSDKYSVIDITAALIHEKSKQVIATNGLILKPTRKNDFIAITTGDSCFMPQIIAFNYQ